MNEIPEGIIDVDSEPGKLFGFTSDKFDGNSYLWYHKDGFIWISFIRALNPGHGHFSQLVKNILNAGFGIKVPAPFPRMQAILTHYGFTSIYEYSTDFKEHVDVWVKRPNGDKPL